MTPRVSAETGSQKRPDFRRVSAVCPERSDQMVWSSVLEGRDPNRSLASLPATFCCLLRLPDQSLGSSDAISFLAGFLFESQNFAGLAIRCNSKMLIEREGSVLVHCGVSFGRWGRRGRERRCGRRSRGSRAARQGYLADNLYGGQAGSGSRPRA